MGEIFIERDSNMKNASVKLSKSSDNFNFSTTKMGDKADLSNFSPNDFSYENDQNNIGLDLLTNDAKKIEDESEEEYETEEGEDEEGDPYMNENFGGTQHREGNYKESPYSNMTHEEIMQKKAFFLSQLKRLESKGHVPSRRLGTEHDIEEIEAEVVRIKKDIAMTTGVNFCKQGLVFLASGLELGNRTLNIGAKLDGFSTCIMATQDRYDEVFEELYEKYASNINAGPEIRFLSMFGMSMFAFHLEKSMADTYTQSGDISGAMNRLTKMAQNTSMRGPSQSSQDVLNSLNDDMSDVSSETSSVISMIDIMPVKKSINIPATAKRRGRPPSKKNQ